MNSSNLVRTLILLVLSHGLVWSADNSATTPANSSASTAASEPSGVPSEGETLHVLVGKSILLNAEQPLTRVLSSNSEAIETMATSPTQVVIEGKAAGGSSLILWGEGGRSQVFDVVADLDVNGLRNAIVKAYPHEHIDVEADGGRVILTGTAADIHIVEKVGKMATVYSKDVVNSIVVPVSHPRQVLLEVKFAEVDRTKLFQLGVNLFATGAGNTIGNTTTGQFGSTAPIKITDTFGGGFPQFPFQIKDFTINQLLNVFLFRPDLHFGVAVQALEAKNALQILAEPNLMAINGEKATFLAGGEFPYPVIQPSQANNAVTIQFKPFGVRLDFLGTIQDDNTLRLHVAPEVSALDFTNALTLSGFTVPAISTRRAETDIELKDGQTFGIAGLLDQRATVQLSKVPGIGSVPILGELFRSRSINKSNNELMVFVTPHIVDPVNAPMTASPAAPKLSVPFLESPKFDENMPGSKPAAETPQGSGAR